jgi:hypothetical protein
MASISSPTLSNSPRKRSQAHKNQEIATIKQLNNTTVHPTAPFTMKSFFTKSFKLFSSRTASHSIVHKKLHSAEMSHGRGYIMALATSCFLQSASSIHTPLQNIQDAHITPSSTAHSPSKSSRYLPHLHADSGKHLPTRNPFSPFQ